MPSTLKQNQETNPKLATEKAPRFPKQPSRHSPERIRTELNLEKWPIWKPAKSKSPPRRRTITREITLLDGNKLTAQVEVGFTDRGELTTEDQKTYYALVKHWEESNHPNEQTYFSIRQVARRLGKGWGTNVINSVTESLIRLRGVLITWTNSYYDASTKETAEVLDTFNVLSELKIIKRKKDGVVNREVGYFRFNDFILKNLLANHTKPVLLEIVLGFKSEIAQILYTYLDLILNDKTLYERRTKELFNDLGLEGKAYRNLSDRKRTLERAIKELTGAPLTTGRIASITLEKTKDEKDHKLVVRKGKLVALPRINHYQEQQPPEMEMGQSPAEGKKESNADQLPHPQKPHNVELLKQAEELVTHFYSVFHSGKNFQITSKATSQAISLITKHGIESSKYIVDYAHREAPKTNFDIQAFGGVIQYSSRAMDDFERRRIQQEQAASIRAEQAARMEQELEQQKREQAAKQRAQAYLDQLPPEQFQTLFEECAAQFKTSEFYRAHYDTVTVQSAIKTLMLRRIIAKQGMDEGSETPRETDSTGSNEPANTETAEPNG